MKKLNSAEIENELLAITAQLLAESGEPYKREIKLDASLQRHLGIDSLGRAELFQRIDKAFDVSMPDRLLAEAETLGDIATYLQEVGTSIVLPTRHEIITSHGSHSAVNPAHAQTLIDVLAMYANASPDKAHIYFQHEDGREEVITYDKLMQNSMKLANGLRERGLQEGETVAIMLPTTPDFFYAFFGILIAGAIPVPIYPPFRMHMLEAYAKTEARILRNAEVRILITFEQAEKLSLLLQSFVPSLKHVVRVPELLYSKAISTLFAAKATNFAFIQYTSGSTSDPKGVLLTHRNLLSNIHAYGHAIKVTSDDVAVSWLPLYHDMGLIGMWLGSLYYGVPLILMTPFSFLNHPERWLWAIHYHRGTLSGAPNFAYELCVRKIEQSQIEGLDLSCWRMAANGAEKIYPRTLEAFAKKFAPYGFKHSALLPVYGLAESTVALTIPAVDKEFVIDRVDRKQFEEDRLAVPMEGSNSLEFVCCGPPIQGHEVRIVNDDNVELPERHVGNLQFRGPSTMQGYFNNPRATQAIYHDGWLESGDLAYQADSEIYITGRRKDLIIKAGRNLYPAEIEEIVGVVTGVRQGCVAAFEVSDVKHGTEQLIIVAETREKNKFEREKIINDIKDQVASALDIVPDHVVLVAPHIVPKTSSGKLQRAACKASYLNRGLNKGQLPPWAQIVKLAAQSILHKCWSGLRIFARSLYTLYIILIVTTSFCPMFFFIKYASRDRAARAVQRWSRAIMRLAFCPLSVTGSEKLIQAGPVIYTPNHASYVDAVVISALVPPSTRVVVKKELMDAPLLGTVMRKLDYLSVDRMDLSKGVEDTRNIKAALERGYSVLIFPEGTFGYASGLRPFRLGAFKVATEAAIPVCPVALKGTRFILRDEDILMSPGRIDVTICDPIKSTGTEWQDVTALRNATRAEIAKYCGEPSLDFIAAQTVAPKQTH